MSDRAQQIRLLTFVIIGGGATGVEMAGAIAEVARDTLRHDFRLIDPAEARVVLVEAGQRLLPTLPEDLSAYALAALGRMGVDVRLDVQVTGCDEGGADTSTGRIQAGTLSGRPACAHRPPLHGSGSPPTGTAASRSRPI